MFYKRNWCDIIYRLLLTLFILAVATGVCWVFSILSFSETNIVIIYLLAILLVARFVYGFQYSVFATLLATGAFNYFFTESYFTLYVSNPDYYVTFLVMIFVALITSTLTTKAKKNERVAKEKAEEARCLYELTNQLTGASNISDIARLSVSMMTKTLKFPVAFLCYTREGYPESTFIQQVDDNHQAIRNLDQIEVLAHRMKQITTSFDINNEFIDWPIHGRAMMLAVLRVPISAKYYLNDDKQLLIRTMIESIALAIDRLRSHEEEMASKEKMIKEQYRANLLRSISHDLRTPLSSIMGTSEMIMGINHSVSQTFSLAQAIKMDAEWLYSLVENILSLTKIQGNNFQINKQLEVIEEVISCAVQHIIKRAPQRELIISIPESPLFVPMDIKLIVQVLINLLDNALKHTPKDKKIAIEVTQNDYHVIVIVKDEGCGIMADDLSNIFEMFYTTHDQQGDSQRGIGLGLTICKTIIEAHGGTITGRNRQDCIGAEFIFTLPKEDGDGRNKKRKNSCS